MVKSKITVYKYPWNLSYKSERENWYQDREEYFSFGTILEGEKAAEFAFTITNAPTETLDEKALELVKDFHGPSVSVGDIVKVDRYIRYPGDNHTPEYYLCKSFGWEKFDEDVIELNKFLK